MVAVSQNNVIGDSKTNCMPWSCKEELKFFKRNTMSRTIVMGRKTAESVGWLYGRDGIVLSRDEGYKLNHFRTITLDMLLRMNEYHFDKEYIICGGANIYEKIMPYCSLAVVSRMKFEADGDVFMPKLNDDWVGECMYEFDEFDVWGYINSKRKVFNLSSVFPSK